MPKTILWAIDALEFEQAIVDSAVSVLEPLASRLGANVQPIHILTPSQLSSATDFSEIEETSPAHALRPAVEHLLQNALKKVALPSLLKPLVIAVESTSIQTAVEVLSRYADSVHAEAIVVSSHGRRGLDRLLLGSFAETLMSHAHCPIVVAHPGTRVNGFTKMLFPSDLSEEGYRHFRNALEIARSLDLEIHLLHCVSYSVEPVLQSGVYLLSGGWMPIHAPLDSEIQMMQKKIDLWVAEARKLGVRATASIYSLGGGIAETILRIAEQDQASLIVMAVESGPIASILLGSVTREVARRSLCPIMVLRSLALKHHGRGRRRRGGGKKNAAA